MISIDDDGEDVDITSSKKKLSNLFDDEANTSIEDSKSKLIYQPKQNNKRSDSNSKKSVPSNSSKLEVLIAFPVQVFKYEKSNYNNIGKYGMALLGNNTEFIYRIILYTGKNQPICLATITQLFTFGFLPRNQCIFHDDQRRLWAVIFSDQNELMIFCRHLCHCLYAVRVTKIYGHSPPPDETAILLPLGYHKLIQSHLKTEIELNDIINFKLQLTGFSKNHSLQLNTKKDSVICIEKTEHRCIVKHDNLHIIKSLFGDLSNPGDCNYVVIPFVGLNHYQSILPTIDEKFVKNKTVSICKFALEVELINIEKHGQSSSNKNNENSSQSSSIDMDVKFTDLPRLNPTDSSFNDSINIQNDQISTSSSTDSNEQISLVRNQNDEISDLLSLRNLIEDRFNLLLNSIKDLKIESKSKNSLETDLSLDSTMLLNSMQKIIEENHRIKAELDEKKLELEQFNQKVTQMMEGQCSNDSDCYTPNNNTDAIIKLKEEIAELKNHINSLKKENYNLLKQLDHHNLDDQQQPSPSPSPRPRRRNQLLKQQLFDDLYEKFCQNLNETVSGDDDDVDVRKHVKELLHSIIQTMLQDNGGGDNQQQQQQTLNHP